MTAMEVIGGRVTNPGATLTALTANTGSSFTVRNTALGTKVFLSGLWGKGGTAGVIRVRSPRMHDNVQGLRFQVGVNSPWDLLGYAPRTILVPQDALTVEQSGGAAETDVGNLLLQYENLPGSDGQFGSYDQIYPRIVDLTTCEVAVTGAATLGDWSAGTAINATFDLLKANTFYAVLGYVCQNVVAAIGIQGPDTGGLKAGGPGGSNARETREWFIRMDKLSDLPCIPIINSANKGGTLVFQMDNAAGATNNVDLLLAELTPA